MSTYVDLVCCECGASVFLGKQLLDGQDRVAGYWHGSAGDGGKNWQSDELMFTLFQFLARHAGHQLEVLDEYQLDKLEPYPESVVSLKPQPADFTGLEEGTGFAVLTSGVQDRGFRLGRPLTRGGVPHLFSGYLAHRQPTGAFRSVWSLLARCQTQRQPLRVVRSDPSWRTANVTALAQGIHADRAFDLMPILADALQDAGCTDEDVLEHCRGSAVHHRGCWVIDLVLGKE